MASSIAKVASLEGQAWAKSPNGTLRPLKVNDSIAADEVVVTATGARIELDFGDGQPVVIAGGHEVTMNRDLWTDTATDKDDAAVDEASVQQVLTVLNNGGDLTETLEAAAAGLAGGADNNGHSFVQLARVIESTTPETFRFGIDNPAAANTLTNQSSPFVNQAPLLNAQNFIGSEDTVLTGRLAASDNENDALSFAVVNPPANGVIALNPVTGEFTFTPNSNFNGTDSFVVSVNDGRGHIVTQTMSLVVNAVNDAPESNSQRLSLAEDTPIAGQITATDADGDTLTYSLQTPAAQGVVTLDPATGRFVYTPNANYNGADSFVVTISDGKGGVTTSVVTLGITPVNDAPTTANQTLNTSEDTPISGKIIAADLDGDSLLYTLSTAAGHGSVTLDPATGAYVYTPAADFHGTDSFVVTVADGKGGFITSTVTVSVAPVNDAPSAVNDVASTAINSPLNNIAVLANDNDADGDKLTITKAEVNADLGSVTVNPNGTLNFIPADNVSGPVVITYQISDGQGGTSTATLTVNVGSNTPPTSANATLSLQEDSSYNFSASDFSFADADLGQVLQAVRIDTLPAQGQLLLNGVAVTAGQIIGAGDLSKLSFVPAANGNGDAYAQFTFSVQDSGGAFAASPSKLSINVTPVDDVSVIPAAAVTITETNNPLGAAGQLQIADIDGPGTVIPQTNVAGTNGYGKFTVSANGAWEYLTDTAHNEFEADKTYVDSITVRAADGTTSTITVTIQGTNDAPIAQELLFDRNEDAAVKTGTLVATDVDANATLTFSLPNPAPAGFTLNPDGSYSFDPSNAAYQSLGAGQSQQITIPYTVTDDQGATSQQQLVITVNGINDAPTNSPVTLAPIAEDSGTLVITMADLLANAQDVDSANLSITGLTITSGGGVLVDNHDGTWSYTPALNDASAVSFSYTVTDGSSTVAGSASMDITPVADKPNLAVALDTNVLSSSFTPPPSEGLKSDYFNAVANVDKSVALNPLTVESRIEATTPTSSAIIPNVQYTAITQDDAYHIQGYIYLEAGHTYQLAGSRDDTLLVKVGGNVLYNQGFNEWGDLYNGFSQATGVATVTPSPLNVTQTGFYSIEVVIYNGDGRGNLDLNLSVDGNPALDLNTTNFKLYPDATSFINAGAADPFVLNGDGGHYPLASSRYSYSSLDVSASLNDTDGSETLALTLTGMPAGTTLTDGVNIFVASNATASTDITQWDLAHLKVIPPNGQTTSFDLTVTATSTDGSDTASQSKLVTISPVDAGSGHVIGTGGADALTGTTAVNSLFGLNGDDTLVGNSGQDLFVGGQGNDTMTGGVGADTFKWDFGDQGTAGSPAIDTLNNFTQGFNGDKLNLSDLLQNENATNLTNYLHFTTDGTNTTIQISSTGAFTGSNFNAVTDQTIVLNNVSLTGTDNDIINQLKNNGNLISD